MDNALQNIEEGELIEFEEMEHAPSAINSSEIDAQIATAHKYPRSIKTFLRKAFEMATLDEDTAASCFYKVPRDKKMTEGPSVRLAEIVASAWGNLRFGARIAEETEKYVRAEGFAHDLETNVAVMFPVMRRITNKYGQRFSDDMIVTTANAASSIALRNAIFRVVPRAYVNQICMHAKKVAVGNAQTMGERRQKVVENIQKMGIVNERIFAAVGKKGIDEIGLDEIETLIGLHTAVKDGAISVDAAFPGDKPAEVSRTESIKDKMKKQVESKVD